MKKSKTNRGFGLIQFTDSYNVDCSIQKSSAALDDYIWLGADSLGLRGFNNGWKNISEEEVKEKFNVKEIVYNSRMHLNREQVKELIPILQKFVDTGTI